MPTQKNTMLTPYQVADAFAADFRSAEYALKRSGHLRKGRKVAEADWASFAHKLGAAFFDQIQASGVAATLITYPPRQLLATLDWSPANPPPLANVTELIINGMCRVRNSYIHGEKFTGGPDNQWERDVLLVAEAHAVLKEAIGIRIVSHHDDGDQQPAHADDANAAATPIDQA
jgi:hypothetical protein